MATASKQVVTGAFGYSGKYIAQRLLEREETILTLTGHPEREHPFGDRVRAAPFDFDQPQKLTETLRGATTLYNTYWVRFCYGEVTYERAVQNTKVLIRAAEDAGLKRIVHVSITNPALDSRLPYFRGKAEIEATIRESKLSYAILRPTVLFGPEDILINNIAWLLRKLPVFLIPGRGDYRLQPIFVEDLADLAVGYGERTDNTTIDAVGPEVFTFEELVRLVAGSVGRRRWLLRVPRFASLWLSRLMGVVLGDVLMTRDELDGLAANLLVSSEPPTGDTRLSEWLSANAATVGAAYHSELARHFGKGRGVGRD